MDISMSNFSQMLTNLQQQQQQYHLTSRWLFAAADQDFHTKPSLSVEPLALQSMTTATHSWRKQNHNFHLLENNADTHDTRQNAMKLPLNLWVAPCDCWQMRFGCWTTAVWKAFVACWLPATIYMHLMSCRMQHFKFKPSCLDNKRTISLAHSTS